jgi:hypothetical protein
MIRRLWLYCEDMFDLGHNLRSLRDGGFSRRYNESLLTTILLTGSFMRLPSLNAFELSFATNRAWRRLIPGADMPSADTLGRGLEKSDVDGLRSLLRETNHKLRRGKAFDTAASSGLMVAAVDGHETIASERRCCPSCLTRKKTSAAQRS